MPAPDFQGNLPKSIPIEQKHETLIDPGRGKETQIITKYQCYLHKNYLILIPPQHNISHGCLWEKKANMEHWYFSEMHAVIPVPHSNGNLWIVAAIFLFSCFNLQNKNKPTSFSNKNNPKQFPQFWNIQKDTSPHCVYIYKKRAKQI